MSGTRGRGAPPASRTPEPGRQLSFDSRIAPSAGASQAPARQPTEGVTRPQATSPGDDEPVLPRPREAPRVFAVSDLVRAARVTMESRFADVNVEGEISGLRPSGNGHVYFTLKDAQAQLDCVMFAREAARLRFRPCDGLLVRCRGRLTIFEGRGKFQMSVQDMQPAGAGALALAFEQLKQKLAAEGLFAEQRKRPLPFLPRRVGIVTSPTGAVIRDIVHVAHRRFPMRLLLSPTAVQGEGAAVQIVRALELLARAPEVDVVIVARGGGSLEDLWAFNEEIVARAIARCPVPVISAVGHETDFTIADFVADRRAPTPSAAAEIAVPELRHLRDALLTAQQRLHRATVARLARAHHGLDRIRLRLADPRPLIGQRRQLVDELNTRLVTQARAAITSRRQAIAGLERRLLSAHPRRRIDERRHALTELQARLSQGVKAALSPRQRTLQTLEGKLSALSPLRVLERGYSLARDEEGRLITRASDVRPGMRVGITVREGQFKTRVIDGEDS